MKPSALTASASIPSPRSLRFVTLLLTAALAWNLPTVHASRAEPTDLPAARLRQQGSVQLKQVGPYVERGSYRIHVLSKLGPAAWQLSDGTWLYRNYKADESEARGVLVVRFLDGRVTSLNLVTPERAAEMQTRDKEMPTVKPGHRVASAPASRN